MSITLGADYQIRGIGLFTHLLEIREQQSQAAIRAAEEAGFKTLLETVPVRDGYLKATAGHHSNQHSVWFTVARNPQGPLASTLRTKTRIDPGNEKAYGYFMEFGWHDRGGGWHDGYHMVEQATRTAMDTYLSLMRGNAMLRPQAKYAGMGDFSTGVPGGF